MNFAHPNLLWLLLVFPPVLTFFFWWAWRERQRLMTLFIEARLLPGLMSGVSPARQKFRFACLIAAVSLLILTLARPQWGYSWEETKQKGLDIVMAIDTSKSMLAEDITPNRLQRAKLAALDLMQQAKSDRLGLVAFAGTAFLQCPLTIDDNAFRQSVESLDVNIIPQGGTALGEAITTALAAYKEGENFKVLVLFTDGEDNDENAEAAAAEAAKAGMKIFTVGIGTPEGEILRVRDAKGRVDYIRDADGNAVKSRLNEDLLRKIASATPGGFYLPLRGAKAIDTLYEKGLAPLPKSEGQEKLVRRYNERYHWPLALAIGFLLLEMILPERRSSGRRKKSDKGEAISGKALPAETVMPAPVNVGVLVLAGLLALPLTVGASPGKALKEYNDGNYDEALKEYQRALEKKKDDLRLDFNAGAAAFRDGKYDVAAKHFTNALAAQDLKLQQQAYYNLGNTLFRAGGEATDPKQRMEAWEGAVKQYDSAIKLNTNDADAKFNQDFVKKVLEELKQQQQQQQNQDQKDHQDKDQEQKDAQQQKDGQQKENKDSKSDQQKPGQSKEDQQKQQAEKDKSEQQKQAEEQAKQQEQQKKDAEKKLSESSGKEPQDQQSGGQPAEPVEAHEMTPQEAKKLLDAQKSEEQVLQFRPQTQPKRANRQLKDW